MGPYFLTGAMKKGEAWEIFPKEDQDDSFPNLGHPGAEGAFLHDEEVARVPGAVLDRLEESSLIDLRKVGDAFQQHTGGP